MNVARSIRKVAKQLQHRARLARNVQRRRNVGTAALALAVVAAAGAIIRSRMA